MQTRKGAAWESQFRPRSCNQGCSTLQTRRSSRRRHRTVFLRTMTRATFHPVKASVFDDTVPRRSTAVYADPPYYGSEKHYRCDPVSLRDLIPRMEELAPVRALSMSQAMLPAAIETVPVPPSSRVCVWAKPWSRAHSWPIASWEPVLIWGDLPARQPGKRTPRDVLVCASGGENRSEFWAPKPDRFCDWVIDLIFGAKTGGTLLDLFSGSGGMSRAAMRRGIDAIGVDTLEARGAWTGDWRRPTLAHQVFEDQDASEICQRAAAGYPVWPYWWTNRHQWKPVYQVRVIDGDSTRGTVPGSFACTECLTTKGTVPQDLQTVPPTSVKLVVRRTVNLSGPNDRQWIPLNP